MKTDIMDRKKSFSSQHMHNPNKPRLCHMDLLPEKTDGEFNRHCPAATLRECA